MSQNLGDNLEANLFPLEGVVFFPTSTLPLNIFEPRYLLMTQDCLDHDRLLAISEFEEEGSIVGVGRVSIFEKRSDGTMVILVKGVCRAKVLAISQTAPFIRCTLEKIDESESIQDSNQFFLQRLKKSLEDWAAQTLPDEGSRRAFMEAIEEPHRLIETFAHYKIPDADSRQQILETTGLDERVELLRRMI